MSEKGERRAGKTRAGSRRGAEAESCALEGEGGLGHQPAGYVRAPGKWVYVAKKPVSCVTNKTSL